MNAVFYCLALLITVLVQTIQGQLDLYHAVFVMHMLTCLTLLHMYGMSCGPTRIYRLIIGDENIGANRFILANRFGLKMKITFTVQVFQVFVVFIPWSLYVWIKGSRFGAQPECNDLVKYVIFFVSIRATVTWLRIFAIVSLSLSASMGVLAWLFGLRMMLFVRRNPRIAEPPDQAPDAGFGHFSWLFWFVSVA